MIKVKFNAVIFILICLVFMSKFMFPLNDEKSETWEKNLNTDLNWLISEINGIDSFMQLPESDVTYVSRTYTFIGRYVSQNADFDKLESLYEKLISEGWIDASNSEEVIKYQERQIHKSDIVKRNTYTLCKNKATMFIYMIDMNEYYHIDLFTVKTAVELDYGPHLPCYDLDSV